MASISGSNNPLDSEYGFNEDGLVNSSISNISSEKDKKIENLVYDALQELIAVQTQTPNKGTDQSQTSMKDLIINKIAEKVSKEPLKNWEPNKFLNDKEMKALSLEELHKALLYLSENTNPSSTKDQKEINKKIWTRLASLTTEMDLDSLDIIKTCHLITLVKGANLPNSGWANADERSMNLLSPTFDFIESALQTEVSKFIRDATSSEKSNSISLITPMKTKTPSNLSSRTESMTNTPSIIMPFLLEHRLQKSTPYGDSKSVLWHMDNLQVDINTADESMLRKSTQRSEMITKLEKIVSSPFIQTLKNYGKILNKFNELDKKYRSSEKISKEEVENFIDETNILITIIRAGIRNK